MAFLAQRAARLNARVIKLGGLTDDDRTRANDEDVAAGHDLGFTRMAPRGPSSALAGEAGKNPR